MLCIYWSYKKFSACFVSIGKELFALDVELYLFSTWRVYYVIFWSQLELFSPTGIMWS